MYFTQEIDIIFYDSNAFAFISVVTLVNLHSVSLNTKFFLGKPLIIYPHDLVNQYSVNFYQQ